MKVGGGGASTPARLSSNLCLFTQKKEALGEDESLPAAAHDLEALTADTLSVAPPRLPHSPTAGVPDVSAVVAVCA